MQKSTVLQVRMEMELGSILPQMASDKNPRIAFPGFTATEIAVARQGIIRFKTDCDHATPETAVLPPRRFRRGKMLTLAAVLLTAVTAHAQSVFSTWQV